jgi:hypothetical protein
MAALRRRRPGTARTVTERSAQPPRTISVGMALLRVIGPATGQNLSLAGRSTSRLSTVLKDQLVNATKAAVSTFAGAGRPTRDHNALNCRSAQPAPRSGRSPTTSAPPPDSSPDPQLLPGGLIDALIEAVVPPPDPGDQSAVVDSLVCELCSAVQWLDGDETTYGKATFEAISIRQLASAALDHHLRMVRLDTHSAEGKHARSWQRSAACRGRDPSVLPDRVHPVRRCSSFSKPAGCASCPVQSLCLGGMCWRWRPRRGVA